MIESIILIYLVWAITSLILCLVYSPEILLRGYGKVIYIIITLPWQILGWIYEPIRRIKFKLQRGKKRGKNAPIK